MTDTRHAILKGKREAARLHREFGMRERIELLGGQVVAEPSSMGFTVEVAVPG